MITERIKALVPNESVVQCNWTDGRNLTNGKHYTVLDKNHHSKMIQVKDDVGEERWLFSIRFKIIR